MDSRLCWIWLQKALGQGNPAVNTVLQHFPVPEAAYAAGAEEFRALGLPDTLVKRLCDKSMDFARNVLWRTLSDGDWLLTPADEKYPPLLRGIYSPPLVLYGRGIMPDLQFFPTVAMVGTRTISNYGRRITAQLAGEIAAAGAVIVSGCAQGGDETALAAALDAGGLVVSVLPAGLDVNTPMLTYYLRDRILQECAGALITEYPYGTRVGKGTFHVRNRLISGMARGVCIPEAPLGSGTLITAKFAREQGRDVFAAPGDITSPTSAGTNALIRDGAKLVTCAKDVLEEYEGLYPGFFHYGEPAAPLKKAEPPRKVSQDAAPPALPEQVSENAKKIWLAMSDVPQPVDVIAAAADIPMAVVFAALTELELAGAAVSSAGQQYCRV